MKKINLCFMAAGVLLVFLMTSCGGSGIKSVISKTPSDVLKASIDDLKNQKFEGMVKYFTRKDGVVFTQQDTAKMIGICRMAYQQSDKKKGIKEVQVVEEKIAPDGNNATVKYKMLFNDGSDSGADAAFRKVNGDWLMVIGG